eukprot:SAG22_NODE_300_length_12752_cov_3.102426_2_plen_242_part_00
MLQGPPFRPQGWLGLICAGALWIPLYQEESFSANCAKLALQVQKAGAAVAIIDREEATTSIGVEAEADDHEERLAELARLREELSQHSTSEQNVTGSTAGAEIAALPAGVPKLPPKLRLTPEITELKRVLLSTDAADLKLPRVGFHGMGGIGKTVTGAALVHDQDIRHHFTHICWLPFGQEPVVRKLQQLLYLQVTSRVLNADTAAERKEQLRIATLGKRVLIVVDGANPSSFSPPNSIGY